MSGNEKRTVATELAQICEQHDGVLHCADVVDAAEDEDSPLHGYFEWDDTKAAQAHRILQARALIVKVSVSIEGSKAPAQVYVSLTTDRAGGGGYRRLIEVLGDSEKREQLLADALAEFKMFEEKYRHLRQLAPIFAAAQRVRRNASKPTGKGRARQVAAV